MSIFPCEFTVKQDDYEIYARVKNCTNHPIKQYSIHVVALGPFDLKNNLHVLRIRELSEEAIPSGSVLEGEYGISRKTKSPFLNYSLPEISPKETHYFLLKMNGGRDRKRSILEFQVQEKFP